ncbi:bifunctional hydroxymethylpyrimidine kinase/phosphomethylpyrimidine kinase [Aquincola sp. S2]|uniref:hydroxymethylpyrimidine kinase n=1 Tax=Pseudaquabacterium terrae TaxID=2732868 RepID=A0ABX2ES73_9BURK|nr:bifunctional hydroxymethylpyrimidine kinase/phosphomethylpyrimidine kinase [Aquabacterium terrae]NRF71473.1 bifunctional hydroxymethylpyrimidine kinase/phosphomethylpyrimidine kinase [Aquabacterium terrae]
MSGPPILWSIAGTDSGGGAGLAADQRAADAFGVHTCPVVAAVTAQHSQAVLRVDAVDPALLDAQLDALADDLPPRVIKTGVLGSRQNVERLARRIDRLRRRGPLALVIDPVLRASSGAALADRELWAALRGELLPRANVITPNRREVALLLGEPRFARHELPSAARALQSLGPATVCITGGDDADNHGAHDWLLSPQATGWLSLPRVDTPHTHGTGCSFASALAAALALGFVAADAAVLAKMAVAFALRADAALPTPGAGPGPVRLRPGFATDPQLLPRLVDDDLPNAPVARSAGSGAPIGLYAIVDRAERIDAVLAAGVRTVQLRIKAPRADSALHAALTHAIAATRQAGAQLFINDHWALALELGAAGVHLGQEDLLALDASERAELRAAQQAGLALGLSSHSLWELARAAAWQPAYVACGPVWATTTKRMPWRPQSLHNLAWWCAVAPAPVVAIGGILEPAQAAAAARCGASGVCIVRGLGDDPAQQVPPFAAAIDAGRAAPREPVPALPRPSLDPLA